MRVFIVSLILLVIIITGVLISTSYIKNLSDDLSKIILSINKYSDNGQFDKAQSEFDKLRKKWTKREKILRALVDHQLIENIHIDMIELSLELKYKQKEDINRECEKMLFKVRHIFEREKLTASNLL